MEEESWPRAGRSPGEALNSGFDVNFTADSLTRPAVLEYPSNCP